MTLFCPLSRGSATQRPSPRHLRSHSEITTLSPAKPPAPPHTLPRGLSPHACLVLTSSGEEQPDGNPNAGKRGNHIPRPRPLCCVAKDADATAPAPQNHNIPMSLPFPAVRPEPSALLVLTSAASRAELPGLQFCSLHLQSRGCAAGNGRAASSGVVQHPRAETVILVLKVIVLRCCSRGADKGEVKAG